jgi:cellulose synthase (UDP-forming)
MTDLYQMLCATEVLKSAWSGLMRPNGQKFKVTAKGGDRSKQFIQWPLLRIFAALLFMTAFGIANAFLIDPSRPLAESSAIALFWSWYNIILLTLCCYVCSERQQRRKGDRFDMRIPVKLSVNGELRDYFASDISVSGMHLIGEMPVPVGTPVRIRFADIDLQADVRRRTESGFGLQFEATGTAKTNVLRYIFSGRRPVSNEKIKPHLLARAITARVFR